MMTWQREHKYWLGEYWKCPQCDMVPDSGPHEDANVCPTCMEGVK